VNRHVYPCPIRWGDLDAQGHVNNAVVVDYLQEARVDFLLTGPIAGMLGAGVIVVAHQVEYLRPIEFSSRLVRVELWVDSVGAARFAISYELFAGDSLVARARTVITPYDLAISSIRRLTADERGILTARVAAPVALRELARGAGPASPGDGGFRWPFRVRWSDLDSYDHVNNVKLYDYLQEARVAALADTWTSDVVVLLVRQDVDYVRPIDFALIPYQVVLSVSTVGTTSMTLAGTVVDADGVVYARGRSIVVCADRAGRPAPIPAEIRARLAGYALSPGDV